PALGVGCRGGRGARAPRRRPRGPPPAPPRPPPPPPPGPDRTGAVVDMIVRLYTGPLFRAALHLWTAAATEEPLRERIIALEGHVGREAHRAAVEFLDADETRPGVRESVQATLDLARGLGLANLLTDDSARRSGVIRQWAGLLESTLRPVRP
ncbi:hypothetical protein ACFV4G_22200, partial [Kitasatospora sp. NPDC059747]